jgi:hypothetical protein
LARIMRNSSRNLVTVRAVVAICSRSVAIGDYSREPDVASNVSTGGRDVVLCASVN